MSINPNLFLHDLDKTALSALKAIPGFSQLLKKFLNIGYEKQFHVMNMGSNLRVDENQLSKYYHMLVPICEKLQIKVPELYIQLDVEPNAATYGDTDPFIVITSGMLETIPDDLIPTVLAHECGHIVCRHTLYRTMGSLIMQGLDIAASFLPVGGGAVSSSLQMAFMYWMRCSELSADRVAAFCDGTPDKMIQLCMHFAGYDKDFFDATPNVKAFFSQVEDYKKLVADSAWNKTLEFLWMRNRDHPQSVIRAYECNEWAKSDQFDKITRYLGIKVTNSSTDEAETSVEVPMPEESKFYVGKETDNVKKAMEDAGFTNIRLIRTIDKGRGYKEDMVTEVLAAGNPFKQLDWLPADTEITITYFKALTDEEDIAAHPGMVRMPESASRFIGRDYMDVTKQLAEAGFTFIMAETQPIKIAVFTREGSVARVTANEDSNFDKGAWYTPDTPIRILYNSADS